jgi:adenosine deaminase
MNINSSTFVQALQTKDLEAIKKIPKADLHNHFVFGGNRAFIREKTGIDIVPFNGIMQSLDEMHKWYDKNLGEQFNNSEMRQIFIDATIVQAVQDGVQILEIGEDAWGLDEYFQGDIHRLINSFNRSQKQYGKDIELRLQIGMSRHCSISSLEKWLEPFWDEKAFFSIDLYGIEDSQPIENFKGIYRKAKSKGLMLKAHVGEWGTAEDVRKAVELLELDEVQHGIAAVDSKEVVKYLRDHNIRLNLTPTSNIILGRVKDYSVHPIKELYHAGVDITINSDDILIFDSDVSKEYLRLYESGVLSAYELDAIRINGLDEKRTKEL